MPPAPLSVFLGGTDLEMETIRELLSEFPDATVYDRGLGWGAKASTYREEIDGELARGRRLVLVELELDLEPLTDQAVVVDHHGVRAGADRPTSLHQVFALLGLPPERWSRWYELVAANDRGGIPGLRAAGATPEEVRAVRDRERRALGVTEEQEEAARQAIAAAQPLSDGVVLLVRLPHGRTAPVTDFLEPEYDGPGVANVLIESPGEVNFFGDGRLALALNACFPGGWLGGELPQRGFWGGHVPLERVTTEVEKLTMNVTHYLRMEGVNLGAFVFDTRDLSTTRGGGLLLLEAVDEAERCLEGELGAGKVRTVSRGASSGLFALETETPGAAAEAVRAALAKGRYGHATFVVDVVAARGQGSNADGADVAGGKQFRRVVEELLALNRWQQMRATTLAVPRVSPMGAWPKPACALDGVRPALSEEAHLLKRGPDPKNWDRTARLSEPTSSRREHGQSAKQGFYDKVVERVAERLTNAEAQQLRARHATLPDAFAREFEHIAKASNGEPLGGKIAVFYADGNGFGKKQTRHCDSADRQAAFDRFLRERREQFLATLVTEHCWREDWQAKAGAEQVVRFETLLWGGDEALFVMPARLGWRFARLFFEQLGGLSLKDAGAGLPDETLTHAAALVFCQHHAPIDRIKRLAKDQMAEFAKSAKGGRDRDSLVVLALESFDHLGASYRDAMGRRYGRAIADVEEIVLAGRNGVTLPEVLAGIAQALDALRDAESFPRSQLRRLVCDAVAVGESVLAVERKADERRLVPRKYFRNADDDAQRTLEGLRSLLPAGTAMWVQLEELWDYARS